MPVIGRDRWLQLGPLLDRAFDLSDEERAPWLAELRAESPELAEELTSLLSGESVADRRGFLVEPVVMPLVGLELGTYTVERPLGQGVPELGLPQEDWVCPRRKVWTSGVSLKQ